MSKYTAADTSRVIGEQVKRIHASIHDGTLDKSTIDDALAKLSDLAASNGNPAPDTPSYGGNSVDQNRAVPTRHVGEPAEQYPLNPPAGNRMNQVDNRGDNRVSPANAGDPKEAQAKVDTYRNPA